MVKGVRGGRQSRGEEAYDCRLRLVPLCCFLPAPFPRFDEVVPVCRHCLDVLCFSDRTIKSSRRIEPSNRTIYIESNYYIKSNQLSFPQIPPSINSDTDKSHTSGVSCHFGSGRQVDLCSYSSVRSAVSTVLCLTM